MNEENLLQQFMAFVDGICSGTISVSNFSILLCLEYCYLMSLNTTTQMHYRDETCKFWECVRNIGGSKLIRLFSSDKHLGKVLSQECDKNRYVPTSGSFNFAVPDDKVLHKSKTNIPRTIEPGIINESLILIDKSKEFVLSLDGKQTGKGLNNQGQGDVDLWGFEGPPSLQQTKDENQCEINFYNNLALQLTNEDNMCQRSMRSLKFALQISSHKIKNLWESIVRHEILRSTFNNKIKKQPFLSSKYALALSEIEAFTARAETIISKLLAINLKWCRIMSEINSNQNEFIKKEPLIIDEQNNAFMLLEPDVLKTLYGNQIVDENPQIVKQRSQEWHKLRKLSKVTSSTMHNVLGFRTLRLQKEH